MVLAAAGLLRLGLGERISEFLPVDVFTPAVGQGALAAECLASDKAILQLLTPVDDPMFALSPVQNVRFSIDWAAGVQFRSAVLPNRSAMGGCA